jgi:uncharacterized membrane protein YphA (DoxX/SURF4 family)
MNALRRVLSHPIFLLALRLALGGMLCYAAFFKLKAPWDFAEKIAGFRLLPAQCNQALAVTLPWQEMAVALLLVLGLWKRPAAWVACAMFASFAVAVSIALARGLDIECGCFGTASGARAGVHTLMIDIPALLAAAWIAWCAGRPRSAPIPG